MQSAETFDWSTTCTRNYTHQHVKAMQQTTQGAALPSDWSNPIGGPGDGTDCTSIPHKTRGFLERLTVTQLEDKKKDNTIPVPAQWTTDSHPAIKRAVYCIWITRTERDEKIPQFYIHNGKRVLGRRGKGRHLPIIGTLQSNDILPRTLTPICIKWGPGHPKWWAIHPSGQNGERPCNSNTRKKGGGPGLSRIGRHTYTVNLPKIFLHPRQITPRCLPFLYKLLQTKPK